MARSTKARRSQMIERPHAIEKRLDALAGQIDSRTLRRLWEPLLRAIHLSLAARCDENHGPFPGSALSRSKADTAGAASTPFDSAKFSDDAPLCRCISIPRIQTIG